MRKLSEETRRKMSESRKGKPRSEKTKKKISETLRGTKLSKEHKAKISQGLRGRKRPPFSEEWKRNISKSGKGRHFSPLTEFKKGEGLGENNSRWQYGIIWSGGYIMIRQPNHRYRAEHSLMAEKVLGRRLKKNECVHHINMIKHDNRNCNLLICMKSYHGWLHRQYAKAFAEEHFR